MCYFHRYLGYHLPLLALITYLERYLLSLLFMFSLLFTALFLIRLFQAVPILLTFYISPTFYRFVPHSLILGGANLTYFLYFTYFIPLYSSFTYSRRCQSCLLSIFHLLFTALFLICSFQAVPILLTFYILPTFYRFIPHSLTLGGTFIT